MSRRTLVFAPARLADALPRLPFFAALAHSGRVMIPLFREGQAAFEPTLLRWRKENTPEALHLPIALPWGGPLATPLPTLTRLAFDEAFLLEPNLGAALLARRAGIRKIWGYAEGWSRWLLSRRVPCPRRPGPLRRREEELLAALGLSLAEVARLDIPRGWPAVGRELLDQAKIDPKRRVIGIYAGRAGGNAVDGWPRASFEALINGLRRASSDLQFVLFAEIADLWETVRLFEGTGKIHPVLGPDLPLTGLLATLTNLDLVIANDSALLHLAGALGVPSLGLFEKDAALRPPPGDGHRQLESLPLCALPAEEVQAAAFSLLEER